MEIIYNTKYQRDDIFRKIKYQKIFSEVDEEIKKYISKRISFPNISIDDYNYQIVTDYLLNLRKLLEEKCKQVSNIFTYYEWLYHIRRIPDIFFSGRLKTTYDYDISLALYVASFSKNKMGKQTTTKFIKTQVFSFTEKKAKYIVRYIYHIKLLSDIDALIRRTSKGVKLIKSQDNWLPVKVQDEYLEESISILDKRMEGEVGSISSVYSRTGISPHEPMNFNTQYSGIPQICMVSDNEISKLPRTFSSKETINISPSYLIYFQEYENLSNYLRSINNSHVFDLRSINIISIFLFLSTLFIVFENLSIVSFYQVGYLLFNKTKFENFVRDYFNEARKYVEKIFFQKIDFDCNVVLSEMKKRSVSSNPFYAPGYFEIGRDDQLCIDLCTCSLMLNIKLEHKVIDGPIANLRALNFEKSLQNLIDLSSFRPDQYIRSLVEQKSLNVNSKAKTDIDAAFIYEGILILISAKSYIYNSEYDKGNYTYIRNIKSNIEKNIHEWREKIEFLNKNLVGDNYDLSDYGEVQGILCTPSLFFLGADFYKSKIKCGLNEYQSSIELYNLIYKH